MGLAVGSTPSRYRRQLAAFHEGVAFVAQVGLFVMLGLLVFPHRLPGVALSGLALAFLLMLVARPLAVWVSTAVSGYTQRERLLLALDRDLDALAVQQRQQRRVVGRGVGPAVLHRPPVQGLGNSGGFKMMLEDRDGLGSEALGRAAKALPIC